MLTEKAIPPNTPQIPRRRRARHRPPDIFRSAVPRLPARKSILLHLPNPLLRHPPHLRLRGTLHLNPRPKHPRPRSLRLHPGPVHLSTLTILLNPILLPRRLPAPMRRPFYSRALYPHSSPCVRHRSFDTHKHTGDVQLLRYLELSDV